MTRNTSTVVDVDGAVLQDLRRLKSLSLAEAASSRGLPSVDTGLTVPRVLVQRCRLARCAIPGLLGQVWEQRLARYAAGTLLVLLVQGARGVVRVGGPLVGAEGVEVVGVEGHGLLT